MIDRTATEFGFATDCISPLANHMTYQFLAPRVLLGVNINWAALLTPLVLVQL